LPTIYFTHSYCTNVEIEEQLDKLFKFFANGLLATNYEVTFRALLHLEELQFFHNIRQYDMDRGHFRKEEEFLALHIDNIAERRPSLVIGDSVRATNPWMGGNNCYEGFIHKVKHNRVLLKFNPQFHQHYNGEDYKLEFCFSRSTFRKQHHAIHVANRSLGAEYFFPSKIDVKPAHLNLEIRDDDLQLIDKDTDRIYPWFNPNLNIIQKEAVRNVVRGECRPMPYIIFGPPGKCCTINADDSGRTNLFLMSFNHRNGKNNDLD
jgi:RNA helicase armi